MHERSSHLNESEILSNLHKKSERGYYTENEAFNILIDEWKELEPSYDSFVKHGIYSREEIKKDKLTVQKIKSRFRKSWEREEAVVGLSDKSVSSEPILMEGIYNYEWLGEGISVVPTKEYDDFVNGIDMVIAIEDSEGNIVHLGIDLTIYKDKLKVDNKLSSIVKNLNEGKLSEVKYYENDDTSEIGPIEVPRVVIGLDFDKDNFNDLQQAVLKKDKKLANHEIKYELLEEIRAQLTFSLDFLLNKTDISEYQDSEDVEYLISFVDRNSAPLRKNNLYNNIIKVYRALKLINNEIREKTYSVKNVQIEYFPSVITYNNLRKLEAGNTKGRPFLKQAA